MPSESLDVQKLRAVVRGAAPVVVTIDGKLGAGKSAVAESLATMTGLPALSLDAILRSAVVEAKRRRVDLADAIAMERLVEQMVHPVSGFTGLTAADLLRSSNRLLANGRVRRAAYARIVEASGSGCIAAGHEIEQAGFAKVDLRIFLRASDLVRARRLGRRLGQRTKLAMDTLGRTEDRLMAAGLRAAAPNPGAIVVSNWFGDVERSARQIGGILLRLLERREAPGEELEEESWDSQDVELMEACL